MFSFNEKQVYQRGSLFLLQVVFSLFYVIYQTFSALIRLRKTSVTFERKECYSIGTFILFPLIGLVVQVLFYGIPAAIIATVIAEVMISIGYALFGSDTVQTVNQLIEAADSQMYQVKSMRHEKQGI